MATTTAIALDTAPPTLDPETLDANTMSDLSLQAELFELYFGQAPEHFAALREALAAGETVTTAPPDGGRTAWRRVGHTMKGTARTLGLLQLGEAALAVEKAPQLTPELVERLSDALTIAQGAALAYMAQRKQS